MPFITDKRIVFITVPNMSVGEKIGDILVKEKLAACVQLLPGLTSIYSWKGKIEKESEVLLIAKTRVELFDELHKRVIENHPYEVPQIVAFPIELGYYKYLQWIDDSVALPAHDSRRTGKRKAGTER